MQKVVGDLEHRMDERLHRIENMILNQDNKYDERIDKINDKIDNLSDKVTTFKEEEKNRQINIVAIAIVLGVAITIISMVGLYSRFTTTINKKLLNQERLTASLIFMQRW